MKDTISRLPCNSQFQIDVDRTSKILRALFYQKREKYFDAYKIWRSLFHEGNEAVREHVFMTRLAVSSPGEEPVIPKTAKSLLLLSKYYSWQKRWQDSLKILQKSREKGISGNNILREIIRLNLYMGNYKEAEQMLSSIICTDRNDKKQSEILWIWLFVLTEKNQKAEQKIAALEEDFLYLPHSAVFPTDILVNRKKAKDSLYRSLTRFPSNKEIFEQLLKVLVRQGDWMELEKLVRSQEFIFKTKPYWPLMAELYLRTGNRKKLNALLKTLNSTHFRPEFYDIIARKTIINKNWLRLKYVAEQYQKHYPDILDGKLYTAEYYRQTGQISKWRKTLRKAGVSIP